MRSNLLLRLNSHQPQVIYAAKSLRFTKESIDSSNPESASIHNQNLLVIAMIMESKVYADRIIGAGGVPSRCMDWG
jgi:hypothetical protein